MNAFPSPAHHTGADDPTPDPSMEEILASIRRIIADDQGIVPPARAPSAPARPSVPTQAAPHYAPAPEQQRRQEPVRQEPARQEPLRQESLRQESPQPFTIEAEAVAPPLRAEAQQVYAQPAPQQYAAPQPQQYAPQQYAAQPAPRYAPEPQPAYAQPAPPPIQQAPQPEPSAFSAPVVANSVPNEAALLSAQADASIAGAFEALTRSMVFQNAPFMEETVRDLLRPMLKQWLDDNLPPLVERLVRSEIERVARGGR